MAVKATGLVGLDVHACQTLAGVLDLSSGELAVCRLMGAPEEVVESGCFREAGCGGV